MRTGLFLVRMPADARLLRERRAAAAREAIAALDDRRAAERVGTRRGGPAGPTGIDIGRLR